MSTETRQTVPSPVVLVIGDGESTYEIALLAAARGARLVLLGASERIIAERVGEIAFGGGRARHVAGPPGDAATVRAALAKATDTFGANVGCALVDASEADAIRQLESLAPAVGRVVLTGADDTSIVLSKVFEA
jgi:hypothetical protein